VKAACVACCLALSVVLTACLLPIPGERAYASETTAPVGLDYQSHPDAASFQALLDDAVAGGVPGAILLVQNPAGLWIGASGQRDLDRSLPMQPFTRLRVGSVSKTFTAAATLLLAEEAALGLDDRIADYLDPEVASRVVNSGRISIRQLLNHTSGLPREPMDVSAVNALEVFWDNPCGEVTVDEYLTSLYDEDALFEPGQGWSYSNFGYALLGLILEDAAGQGRWEVLRTRILQPLGLADTFFNPDVQTPPGLARGYADLYGDGSLTDTSDWDALHVIDVGGGIVSTAYDLYRLLDALFNAALLTGPSLGEMLTLVQASPEIGLDSYGLGIGYTQVDGKFAYTHTGTVMGYVAAYYFYPAQQAFVVLLTNASHGAFLSKLGELLEERLPPLL